MFQNSIKTTATHTFSLSLTHTNTHVCIHGMIIAVSYFFHCKKEHRKKIDEARNIYFITRKSLCVEIVSLKVKIITENDIILCVCVCGGCESVVCLCV
jgi:hypothetical protein